MADIDPSDSRRRGLSLDLWGDPAEEIPLLQAEIGAVDQGRVRGVERRRLAGLFHQLGRQQLRLGKDTAAARAFLQAYALAPRFRPNLRCAQGLYELRGDYQLLVRLLAAEAAACDDPAQRSGLMRRQAMLLWARLEAPDKAREVLAEAHRLSPGDLGTLKLMELLCAATGDLDGVDKQLRLQTRLLPPSPRVAALLTCRALLAAPRRQGKALALLRQALELDPHNQAASSFMEQLLDQQGDVPGLAPLLEELMDGGGDGPLAPGSRSRLLARAARVLASGESDKALPLALGSLEANPDAEVAQELMELLLRGGNTLGAAEIGGVLLGLEMPHGEAQRVAAELAELNRTSLGRPELAARCYREVLARDPGHPLALEGMEQLLGDRNAGVELGELRRVREAGLAAARHPWDRRDGLLACARLAEQDGEPDKALEWHGELQISWPEFLPSLQAQERLFSRLGRWTELLQLYDELLTRADGQPQITRLLEQMAWVWQHHLAQMDSALECHQTILAGDPEHLPSIRAAARLCAATGRYEELLGFNELEATLSSSPARKAELACASARMARGRLQDEEQAAELYKQALLEDPDCTEALEALRGIYRRRGAWRQLVQLLQQRLAQGADPAEALSLLHEVAQIQQERLEDPEGAGRTLETLLEQNPSDGVALEALLRLYRQGGQTERAILKLEGAARARGQGSEAARWLTRAATLKLGHQDDAEGAERLLRRALEHSPGCVEALCELEQLAPTPGRAAPAGIPEETSLTGIPEETSLAGIPEGTSLTGIPEETSLTGIPEETAITRTVKVPLTSAGGARALLLDGAGGPAAGEGELALRAMERWARMVGRQEELEAALRQRLERCADAMERSCLHAELGEMARDRGDHDAAEQTFGESLECYAGHPGALWGLARIYTEQGRWLELARVFQREAEAMAAVRCRHDALIRAAIVLEERVGARSRALDLYQQVLDTDPLHEEAFQRLAPGLEADQRFGELASLLRARINCTSAPEERAVLLCRLGRLYVEQLRQERKGMACLRRATELAPESQEVLIALADRHYARQEWQEAEDLYTRTISTVEAPVERSRIRRRLGEIQLGMDMPLAALGSLQLVRQEEEQPGMETLRLLLRAARAARDARAQREALEQLLDLEEDPEQRVALLKEGARLLDEDAGDPARAISLLEEALDLAPVDIEAIEQLAAVHGSRGDKGAVDRHLSMAAGRVRQKLQEDPLDGDTYRQLGRIYKWQRQFDAFFCSCVARAYLEEASGRQDLLEEAERSFLTLHQYRGAPVPVGRLVAHRLDGLLLPRDAAVPLRKLLHLGRAPLHRLIAMAPEALGLGADSKVPEGHPLNTLCQEIAGQLGGGTFELHISRTRQALIAAEVLETPALIISDDLARGLISPAERFRIGRALFLIREGALPLLDMTTQRALALLGALGQVAAPPCPLPLGVDEEALARESARLEQVTDSEDRRRLGEALPEMAESLKGANLDAFKAALQRGANRAGLAVAGDPFRALQEAGSLEDTQGVGPLTADLLTFLVDPRFIALRRDLGLSPGAGA